MNETTSTERFALHRIDESTWVIRDAGLPDYAARPIAHITVSEDDEVEVIWSAPLPLPVMFATPQDVLQSLEDWARGGRGSTKPIPIPHFPPPRPR